mgnify:CR=1 FL=1
MLPLQHFGWLILARPRGIQLGGLQSDTETAYSLQHQGIMEAMRSCFRRLKRAAAFMSPAAAAVARGWKAITPHGVAACWLPDALIGFMYSPMMFVAVLVVCLVLDLLAFVVVAVHWLLGLLVGWAAVFAVIVVFVRQGGIAASYPGVADMVANSVESEMAGQVQRDFVSAVQALHSWARMLDTATPGAAAATEAAAAALLREGKGVHAALECVGFKEDSVHPDAPHVRLSSKPDTTGAAPRESGNPLMFTAGGASSPHTNGPSPCLLPPRRAVLSLARFVAAARLQCTAGTLTPYSRRLAHDTAALLTASRALAGATLQHLSSGSASSVPLDAPLAPPHGTWPATASGGALPSSPAEEQVARSLQEGATVRTVAQLVLSTAQHVSLLASWLKQCPPLESPAGTPLQQLKRLLCVQRCCSGVHTYPDLHPSVCLSGGVRVLAACPALAASAGEGGGVVASAETEDATADAAASHAAGTSDDMAKGAAEFLRGAADGVVSLIGAAQRNAWSPAGGFDFLRADLQAAHPAAQVLWIDTQAITQAGSLPAAGAPCCSDVGGTSCEAWGGACTPHSRRARGCEAAMDDAFHAAFHSVPLLSACMGAVSCLACHGFCCRSRGRRLHRRLPQGAGGEQSQPDAWSTSSPRAAGGYAMKDIVASHVQIGLGAAQGCPDDKLLLSAVFVPCPEQNTSGPPERRPVLLFCEPNMGMWEMQSRFSDSLAQGHAKGMHVLLWNYRGYGLSDGSPSPAAARHDVTAIKAVLQHHPALCGAVGPLAVHGTSIGGLPAAELLAAGPVATSPAPVAAVFDRNFASLPATAERMVAWWARPGMHALLPSWALDNTSLFCGATHVPRVLSADPLNDTIIAWPASLAASVASTVAAQRMGSALSAAFPGEQYALALGALGSTLQQAREVLGSASIPSLGVFAGALPAVAPRVVSTAPPRLRSPRRRSLADAAAAAGAPRSTEQQRHDVHDDERYHSSPCCHPRARHGGGRTVGAAVDAQDAASSFAEDGSAEESAPLVGGSSAPAAAAPVALGGTAAKEVLPAVATRLVSSLGQLLQLSSFAMFHRNGPMPLLELDIYRTRDPVCGPPVAAADGQLRGAQEEDQDGLDVHTAKHVSPQWSGCTAQPIQRVGHMSSTPPDRLWCVILPGDARGAVNDVLQPQPWVRPQHVSEQALQWGSKVLHHLHRTAAWRAPSAPGASPPSLSAEGALRNAASLLRCDPAAADAALHAALREPRSLSLHASLRTFALSGGGETAAHWSSASQRGASCALSLGVQGVHPGMGYVIAALGECWSISNGSWCLLGQLLAEHSHFRGKVDASSLGAWLAAGLVWGWASDDAVLTGPGADMALKSVQSAYASLSLAGAVLCLPSPQHAAGVAALRAAVIGAMDSLNLIAHLVGGYAHVRMECIRFASASFDEGGAETVRQACLPEGLFLPLRGGHNSPLDKEQQESVDAFLREILV